MLFGVKAASVQLLCISKTLGSSELRQPIVFTPSPHWLQHQQSGQIRHHNLA